MGTIRRAAVTGLFAAWLAPLTASADNPSTGRNAGGDLRVERPADPEVERPADPEVEAAAEPERRLEAGEATEVDRKPTAGT